MNTKIRIYYLYFVISTKHDFQLVYVSFFDTFVKKEIALKTEEEIRNELASVIENDPNNYSRILSLSNELARFDKDNVRFSVDAGIINRLGIELVGKRETAVAELVKNAYDADAPTIDLIFENAYNSGGQLYILDTGEGMTREQLVNGFMRLSSSDKIHNPISKIYKRKKAGKKGIGRFATQRLGDKLTIITQTKESDQALMVTIDWNKFDVDKDIASVANKIIEVAKQKEKGTDLIISNLRDGWSDAYLKRIYRHISSLLQPFPLSKEKKDRSIDPGFSASIYRESKNVQTLIVDEAEAFYNHALAVIEGFVDENGQGYWKVSSDKFNYNTKPDLYRKEFQKIGKYKESEISPFSYIKDVHFKAYYFIYDSSLLPPQTLSYIRGVAVENGGIRLYRNGFRVLPYGEQGDDWIGLDYSVTRRTVLAPHQNNSFFGFVEIKDSVADLFEETASREGLLENDAFFELKDYIFRVVINSVLKVAELRQRKGAAAQKDWKSKEKLSEVVDKGIYELKNLIDDLKAEESSRKYDEQDQWEREQERESFKERFKTVLEDVIENREEEKKETQKLIDENNMLRILAGLGLVIGEFVHEIKRFLPGFDAEIKFLEKVLKDNPKVLERLVLLEKNLKSFGSYTSYFDETISRNVIREIEPINMKVVISDFLNVIENDLHRSDIIMTDPIYKDFDIITLPMHPSEWASILFNFYTNAKKAIAKTNRQGKIGIRSGVEGNKIFLEFSDNGIGIPESNKDLVFDAFFTTSSARGKDAKDIEVNVGTGLGLKIVRDIIESYKGSIEVIEPLEGYATTIRIELPKN